MKILIVSDTHGYTRPLAKLIADYANEINMVIHLGDHAGDLLDMQPNYPDITMVAVAGNCDFSSEHEKILSLEGRRLLLLHGHRNGVKLGLDRLFYYAKEKEADVCLFGHTHMQVMFNKEGILVMNPGSLTEARGGSREGFGIIEIDKTGEIRGEVYINDRY